MQHSQFKAMLGGLVLASTLLATGAAAAADGAKQTTTLAVRVIAAGAEWVSPKLGGADVRVTDALSGEFLAKGQIEGDSDDTNALMDTARTRSAPLPIDLQAPVERIEPGLAGGLDNGEQGRHRDRTGADRNRIGDWLNG